MRPIRSQRGTALVMALLVLAIALAAALAMVESQDLQQRNLQAERDHEQARWMLRGGMHWARSILAEDARSGSVDHRRELWASGLPATDVQIGALAGEIRDAQASFNLNNLVRGGEVSPPHLASFRRLLAALGRRPELADAIAAAAVQAGRPLADLAELAGARGIDADTLARLERYATALPHPTPVNVNTAPPEVLVAVVDGLTLPEAQALERQLALEPARRREEFQARLRQGLAIDSDEVSVGSRYFVVHGRARVGATELRLQALLERGRAALPAIVWQRAS